MRPNFLFLLGLMSIFPFRPAFAADETVEGNLFVDGYIDLAGDYLMLGTRSDTTDAAVTISYSDSAPSVYFSAGKGNASWIWRRGAGPAVTQMSLGSGGLELFNGSLPNVSIKLNPGVGSTLSGRVVVSGLSDAPGEGLELNSVTVPLSGGGDGTIVLAESSGRISGIFHLIWEGPNRIHDVIFAVNGYHHFYGEIKIISQLAYAGAPVFSNLRFLRRGDGYHIQLAVDVSNRNGGTDGARVRMLSGRADNANLNPGGDLYPVVMCAVADITASNATFAQGPVGPAIQITSGYTGMPRIQLFDRTVDSQAWMGSGVDMGGGPYEHSLYFPATSGGAGRLAIGSYDGAQYAPKLTLLQNGNLGIGTSSPTNRFEVQGGSIMVKKVRNAAGDIHPILLGTQHVAGTGGVSGIAVREEGSGGFGQASGLVLMTSIDDHSPENHVYITSVGNVGIGVPAPSVPLEVQGAIKASGTVTAPKVRVAESGDLSMGGFIADGGLGAPSD